MAAALPYGAAVADDAHDLDTFCLPDALHALHAAAAPPPPPPPQSLLQARAPTPTPPPTEWGPRATFQEHPRQTHRP